MRMYLRIGVFAAGLIVASGLWGVHSALAQSSLTVSTYPASNVGSGSAALNGYASNPGHVIDVSFQWGNTSSMDQSSGSESLSGGGNFFNLIGGLSANTTYYFRAVGTSDGQVAYGETQTFRTPAGPSNNTSSSSQYPAPPDVQTRSATNVSQNYVTLQGYIDPNGADDTQWWFQWGEGNNLTSATNRLNLGQTTSKLVSISLSNLKPDTLYYYRLVAQSSGGMVTGNTYVVRTTAAQGSSQQTSGAVPTVITQDAQSVTGERATLSGTILPGAAMAADGWFEWGINGSLNNTTQPVYAGSTASAYFAQTLGGLSPNTSYSFRAVGRTANGIAKGEIKTFTTGSISTSSGSSGSAGGGSSSGGGTSGGSTQPAQPSQPSSSTSSQGSSMGQSTTTILAGTGGINVWVVAAWLCIILLVLMIVLALHKIALYRKQLEEAEQRREELERAQQEVAAKKEQDSQGPPGHPGFKLPGQQ